MRRSGLVPLIAAFALAGCFDSPRVVRGELGPVTEESSGEAVLGLCETRDTLERSFPAARDVFFDRSHDQLHVIASALQEVDRPAAARVLESMSRLETDFLQELTTARTTADLEALIGATRAGLDRLGLGSPACP